jgi:hypothetical protein
MLKPFLTLLLATGIFTAASAQTKGKTEFGINVGLNTATVFTNSGYGYYGYTNPDYRVGFNVGLTADHYFSDRWSLKAKVIYDQKGWDSGYISFNDNSSYATDYKLNYLTIPVMANWHFGRTRNWYLNFGPYIGILLNAKESAKNTDVKPYINNPDGGLAVGIGVKFPIGEGSKFFIEYLGQGGVGDVFKNNFDTSVNNSVSSFNIGVTF